MKTDFLDSHERHMDDAERLFQASRWANADHLFGISAECGLKRLMQAFGMTVDPVTDRPAKKDDQRHANGIWARFEVYRAGHVAGVGYVLPSTNPFGGWDVSDRYAQQSNFTQATVLPHQTGAQAVSGLVKKAQKAGLI